MSKTRAPLSLRSRDILVVLASLLVASVDETIGSESPESAERRPGRFAIIFNMGYAGDHLPNTPAEFERLIAAVKRAHFNVVLCKYEPWRAKICKKYDVQIFVDLLAPGHHVYKDVEGAKRLCTSLRDQPIVYGYHLWSDRIGSSYPGRSRDVKNVHEWDPTHAAYVGTYQMSRVNRVEGLDLLGYYDFHWQRGGHWSYLSKASRVSTSKDAYFLRYCEPAAGRVGVGNVNRVAYTVATSIPFGLKGYTFHYRNGIVDAKTGKLDTLGKDLQKVNAAFASIGDELIEIGHPSAVFSTAVTRSNKDRPIEGEPAVPAGLSPIPEDHAFQVLQGEVVLGMFRDDRKSDVVALASHNAYQPQKVVIELTGKVKRFSLFDRSRRRWRRLTVKKSRVGIEVAVSATELIRIER